MSTKTFVDGEEAGWEAGEGGSMEGEKTAAYQDSRNTV
jgi:hypothetical protein